MSRNERRTTISYRRWELSLLEGASDVYYGSTGTAQLYLDAKANAINPQGFYNVNVSMSRSRLKAWSISHIVPFKWNGQKGYIQVAVDYVRVHRFQQGNLVGQMRNNQFQGTLLLRSTRGMRSGSVLGHGVSLDIAVIASVGKRLHFGIWGEDIIGRVWWQRIRDIRARVATNTIEPDADGFLHAVPFLSGSEREREMSFKVAPRWTLGCAWRVSERGSCLLFLSRELPKWEVRLGYNRKVNRGRSWWFAIRF
ncbi:MAG TPA: hypothetical protein EYP10_06635, partial [Armatimonadetes bacterium]|nr:hypothetical protein [Armatimonadota bacterium]